MNIFEEYIENSFSGIPASAEIQQVKQDLLVHMNEKYEELIQAGVSPHEAIGSVIVDFGDIDELLIEMGYKEVQTVTETPAQVEFMTMARIRDYIDAMRRQALMVAAGVAIILLGVALGNFIEANEILFGLSDDLFGVIVIVAVALAVGLFIYSGTSLSGFEDFEQDFLIKNENRQIIEREYNQLKPDFQRNLIIGVVTIILAPVYIILAEDIAFLNLERNSVSVFLLIIAIGVAILIFSGMTSSSYDTILKRGKSVSEYFANEAKSQSPAYKNKKKNYERMQGLLWALVVATFFIWGFIFDGWAISWVVYPIAGVLINPVLAMIYDIDEEDE